MTRPRRLGQSRHPLGYAQIDDAAAPGWTRTQAPWFHDDMLDLAARRPTVSNPALKRGRAISLERVTMRPQTSAEQPKAGWRAPVPAASPSAAAAMAAVLIAAVPLAHAAAPDPWVDATPIEIALAPEPIETARPIGDTSVADIAFLHKVEGIKANPYETPTVRARPVVRAQGIRPRIVRKAPRSAAHEPQKMSDLKANPYD